MGDMAVVIVALLMMGKWPADIKTQAQLDEALRDPTKLPGALPFSVALPTAQGYLGRKKGGAWPGQG